MRPTCPFCEKPIHEEELMEWAWGVLVHSGCYADWESDIISEEQARVRGEWR